MSLVPDTPIIARVVATAVTAVVAAVVAGVAAIAVVAGVAIAVVHAASGVSICISTTRTACWKNLKGNKQPISKASNSQSSR